MAFGSAVGKSFRWQEGDHGRRGISGGGGISALGIALDAAGAFPGVEFRTQQTTSILTKWRASSIPPPPTPTGRKTLAKGSALIFIHILGYR